MEIKIEKNIPIPSNNPHLFKGRGRSKWSVLSTMKVGDSFLLESVGIAECHNIELDRKVKAIRSWVYAQRKLKGTRIRVVQRKQYLEDGRLAYRIWRVSDV